MAGASRSMAVDLAAGALAASLATVVMGKVTGALYDWEDRPARRREDRARGGQAAYEILADRGAELVGLDLSEDQTANAGLALHYSIGATSGAVYAAVRPHIPLPPLARGLAFGAALWLVADEGMNPALGLTPGPAAFPWQTHARGLVGHLVFGAVTEGVLSLVDRLER